MVYLQSLAKKKRKRHGELRKSWPKRVLLQAIQLRWQFQVHIFYLLDTFFSYHSVFHSMFTEKPFSSLQIYINAVRYIACMKNEMRFYFFLLLTIKVFTDNRNLPLYRCIKCGNFKWFLLATVWLVLLSLLQWKWYYFLSLSFPFLGRGYSLCFSYSSPALFCNHF